MCSIASSSHSTSTCLIAFLLHLHLRNYNAACPQTHTRRNAVQWRSDWHCAQGKLGSKAIHRNGRNVSLPTNFYAHSQGKTSPITSFCAPNCAPNCAHNCAHNCAPKCAPNCEQNCAQNCALNCVQNCEQNCTLNCVRN